MKYYCKICDKDSSAEQRADHSYSEQILEIIPVHHRVFVKSFNPVLVAEGGVEGWRCRGGGGGEHFLWCLSLMKELIVTTRIILQGFFLSCLSLSSELFTLLMFSLLWRFWIKTEINRNNIAQQSAISHGNRMLYWRIVGTSTNRHVVNFTLRYK